jgi:hypothetical protein
VSSLLGSGNTVMHNTKSKWPQPGWWIETIIHLPRGNKEQEATAPALRDPCLRHSDLTALPNGMFSSSGTLHWPCSTNTHTHDACSVTKHTLPFSQPCIPRTHLCAAQCGADTAPWHVFLAVSVDAKLAVVEKCDLVSVSRLGREPTNSRQQQPQ